MSDADHAAETAVDTVHMSLNIKKAKILGKLNKIYYNINNNK